MNDFKKNIYKQGTKSNNCFASILQIITYSAIAPIGYTITGQILTDVYLQYSNDNITWTQVAGIFPAGTTIFTNNLPTTEIYVRVVAICNANQISNVLHINCPCRRLVSFYGSHNSGEVFSIQFQLCGWQQSDLAELYSAEMGNDLVQINACIDTSTLTGDFNNIHTTLTYDDTYNCCV